MEEPEEISDPRGESMIDNMSEKSQEDDGTSSSSESDSEAKETPHPPPSSVKERFYDHVFDSERPVQNTFDGGDLPDIFSWKNKKISASVLCGATAIWVSFVLLEYHLLTFVCHISIFGLGFLFLWSNTTTFINKRPPHIPEVRLPEDPFIDVASVLHDVINHALAALREIAAARDLRKFLWVVAVLWVVSIAGSCCNFLTLFYIAFVFLQTVPVLYEKYCDEIDAFAEKALIVIKKLYAVFDDKVLRKIRRGPLDKKHA